MARGLAVCCWAGMGLWAPILERRYLGADAWTAIERMVWWEAGGRTG